MVEKSGWNECEHKEEHLQEDIPVCSVSIECAGIFNTNNNEQKTSS